MDDGITLTATRLTTNPSTQTGVVVLVSYHPQLELFRGQLESIKGQTRKDFRCIIAADGDVDETRRSVIDVVGTDDRFEVIGFPTNVGVYLNVERALRAVPLDVGWVALSDQDDRWYPDKLERLVPQLDKASLVLGQARVVSWPAGEVLRPRTTRRVVPSSDLVFENQVTGSFAVFRRDVLDVALPFPPMRAFTRFHDHWIGVCAATTGGYVVVDDVVQDYVQHAANQVGELLTKPRRSLSGSVRRIRRLADESEGGHSMTQCARTYAAGSFGWRRAMTDAIIERVPHPPADFVELASHLDVASGPLSLARMLLRARRSPHLSDGTLEAFVAGLPYELLQRLRRPHHG